MYQCDTLTARIDLSPIHQIRRGILKQNTRTEIYESWGRRCCFIKDRRTIPRNEGLGLMDVIPSIELKNYPRLIHLGHVSQ